MTRKSILVVDDEVSIRKALSKALEREGYLVTAVKSVAEATAVARDAGFHLLLCDLQLPDGNGLQLIQQLKHSNPELASVIITGNATVESAIQATKDGVFHYVTKPFNIDEVLLLARKALKLEELSIENKQLKQALHRKYNFDNFIGDSQAMMNVFSVIEKVANTDSTVLITGESGTGKELVARALHYNSSRSDKLFIPVNCGAIPAGLLESELFGHVKGSFTGAIANRPGRFQAADGGTLFLDEIGEMSPDLQVKLLRALQYQQIEPVGSVKPVEIDARIIAATNLELEKAVVDRRFREDLYYRLNVIPIVMPPLRERRGDIPLLVNHFLALYNEEKKCDVSMRSEEVMDVLMAYDWPGNVRELENLVQRMVILKHQGEIEVRDLPQKFFHSRPGAAALAGKIASANAENFLGFELPEDGVDLKALVNSFEDHLLRQALQRTNGNKNKASELLKMNRTTLVEKLKKKQLSYEARSLRLSRIAGGLPHVDFTDSTAKQKLKLRLGTVPMPNARGELVPQETENRIELHYSRGRLTELSSEVVESRNPERVVFGRTHNYRWESGRCLPTRITMRNRVALADKTGVVFDSALCRRLRDRHGFNVAKAEECVQSVTDTYRRIVDFDNELREESGGEEFLVTVNPLAPGAVAALRGTPESAITVGWMAACADFLRAHEAPARPAAGPRAAGPDPASSARTAE